MDHTIRAPKNDRRKRLSSRPSSTADDFSQSVTSPQVPKPSSTYAHYRWAVLDKARIYVCIKPPPEDILARINAVVQRKIAEGRKKDVATIAQQLSNELVRVLDSARKEDDSVELIHRAL